MDQCDENTLFGRLKHIKWTVIECPEDRPIQTNSYSCGLYAIYYTECAGRDISMNRIFDPEKFRYEVAMSLLSSSRNMEDVCLYCGPFVQEDYQNTNLFDEDNKIICNICKRFNHHLCLSHY